MNKKQAQYLELLLCPRAWRVFFRCLLKGQAWNTCVWKLLPQNNTDKPDFLHVSPDRCRLKWHHLSQDKILQLVLILVATVNRKTVQCSDKPGILVMASSMLLFLWWGNSQNSLFEEAKSQSLAPRAWSVFTVVASRCPVTADAFYIVNFVTRLKLRLICHFPLQWPHFPSNTGWDLNL